MKNTIFILTFSLLSFSCGPKNPEPIKLNVDVCDFCKMTISDEKFGCEIITQKGRIYKFDDLHCLLGFKKENDAENSRFFASDFEKNNVLIPAETAFYIKGGNIKSPMRGDIAALSTEIRAREINGKIGGEMISWNEVCK